MKTSFTTMFLVLAMGWNPYGDLAAQDTLRLSLADLYAMADTAAQAVRSARASQAAAQEATRAARAAFLPDVHISLSASYIGDGWLSDRDYSDGRRIDMPHFGNNFAVEATQVVYAGGALTSALRMAELSEQMASLDMTRQQQEVRFLLTGHYLDLYRLDNSVRALDSNIALMREVLHHMHARLGQGTVLANDLTRYELQLQTLELQRAKLLDAAAILNHQLATTLHLPEGVRIVPDSTLLTVELCAQNVEAWQTEATAHHVALRQAAVAGDMARQRMRMEQAERLPHVALIAQDHLDGPILIEVPTIDNNFNYWFVGLGVQYNLASLYKGGARVRQARREAEAADAQLALSREQVQNDVQAAYVHFLTAFTEVETQRKSVELATQNYTVTAHRYDNGVALLTDMLDASSVKLAADLALVDARIGLIYQYYRLRYAAGKL